MSLKVYVFLVFTLTATSFASPVENVSQTKQEVTGNVAQEVAAAASSAAETVASATPIQTQQVFKFSIVFFCSRLSSIYLNVSDCDTRERNRRDRKF